MLEKFIFTEWKFHNTNTQALAKSMSPIDQQLFNIDINSLRWEDYFINLAQGVRQYLNNESPKNLEKARKKDKMLVIFCFSNT